MFKELKKSTNRSAIYGGFIALVMAIIFIAITKLTIIDYIKGPIRMEETKDYSELENKYVSFHLKYPLEIYAEKYSEDTDTKERTTTNYGYVVYDDSKNALIGVVVPKAKAAKVDVLFEEAWKWFSGEIDIVSGEYYVTGTLTKMDQEHRKYYYETLTEVFGEDDIANDTGEDIYLLTTDEIRGESILAILIMSGIGSIGILIALFFLTKLLTKGYRKNIDKYLCDHMTVSEGTLEADFMQAIKVSRSVWIGNRFTFAADTTKVKLIEHTQIVWIYYYQRTGRYAESKLKYFDVNGKMIAVNISKNEAMRALDLYQAKFQHIVLGYDRSLETTYNKDRAAFLNIRYRQNDPQYGSSVEQRETSDAWLRSR